MSGAFSVLIVVALAVVLLTLVVGIIAMLKGREFNVRHGNRLMRLRIALQFGALVLIGLAFLRRDG